jgi:hypothetical protein
MLSSLRVNEINHMTGWQALLSLVLLLTAEIVTIHLLTKTEANYDKIVILQ